MKKIIVGILGLVMLMTTAPIVSASSTWNGASNDCKGLSILNATTNNGYGYPCWPSASISADAGDTLNVRIYYHNTGSTTANNTHVVLNAQLGSASTTKSFSGSISSDQGGLSLGSVTANLSSSQTLTFNSVKWYTNNTSETLTPLLNGQSGSEILNGGLDIGSIAPGWATQGSLVVSFHVSNTAGPQLCQDSSATNYGEALPCNYTHQNVCKINDFNPNPSSITKGDSSILTWNTTNCDHATISNIGSVSLSGSQTVRPNYTTTYTLTAYNSNGEPVTKNSTVYVDDNNSNNCTIRDFSASDTSISDGDSVTLEWGTNGCDRVKITDIGDVSDDGSARVYPSEDTTYLLTAYDSDGSHISRSIKIYVDDNNNYNSNDCSIDSFTASRTSVIPNGAVTLRWKTTDCNNVNISGIGNVADDGTRVVYPYGTTIYVLRAYGRNIETRSVQVDVDNYNFIPQVVVPVNNSCAVTTVATNVNQFGAQLNGIITNSFVGVNSLGSSAYFEYGTDINFGSRTTSRFINTGTNFTEIISNLSPNTIYYFRMISNCQNGTSYGNTEIFRTPGYANTNTNTNTRIIRQTVVQQGNTISGSASPIILRIEDKYQTIGVGDIIDYVVYYKNISSSTLTNPMVQVTIPQGITLLNASIGTYSESDRILSAPIENLNPNAEGVIYLQARVDSMDSNLAQIVTTVVLVYTNPNGAQENAMAYVLNNPKTESSLLGASAFFGNIFGLSLIGWLILIILILLLILIARSLYARHDTTVTSSSHTVSHS